MSNPQTQASQQEEPATDRLARAVRAAETALIEYEIAVESFRVEVENFSRLHHQRLGPVYRRLDELEALIAEEVAARTGDPRDLDAAREARAALLPMPGLEELLGDWVQSDGLSPEALAMLTDQPVRAPERVRPSEEARRRYRELVREAHPDLTTDPAERERREAFVVRVNQAYARGDVAELTALAEEWAAGPVPEPDPLSAAEELYARLEWLADRRDRLTRQVAELEESAVGSMLKLAADDPDGLLDEIADQLQAQVVAKEARLAELRGGTTGPDGRTPTPPPTERA
ncbi:J domain-containing protein [Streptomyces durbertensis]|uniref:J domain-containing protein n=1 Tax=Streptomyces durbertensis TaxID=2448886 RepID=A0ABR6EP09_9ACTN|nr:J domain-containing protein [Streptomyces durbertensis]MBB1247071.1 J domain-containing protein [Streptomyces durbertensis]